MAMHRSKSKIKYLALVAILAAGAIFFFINKSSTTSVETVLPIGSASSSGQISTSSLALSSANDDDIPQVTIHGADIAVELSTTTAAIQQGLSGRLSLDPGSGMLFIFSKPAIYRFWMPDMHFPLDMIWINDGAVVDISANVPTTFDPADPTFYRPDKPAQYVLEVNAGFSAAHGIVPGDTVVFSNIPLLP
jgi:uncharacterized membrane protein (UPF0127 family)